MENNLQKYELSQNGRNYILTTEVQSDYVRITCVESGISNPPIFFGEFTLAYLRQLSKIFNTISTIAQAQEIINQTIETEKVLIEHKEDIINITLYLQRETESENSQSVIMNGMNNEGQSAAYSRPLAYNTVENVTTKTIYTRGSRYSGTNGNTSVPIQTITTPEVYTTTTTTTTTNENYQNYDTNQNYDNANVNVNYDINQNYENIKYENNVNYETNQNYDTNQNYENVNYENNVNYETNQNYENVNYENTVNYETNQNYNLNINTETQHETNTYGTTVTTGVDSVTLPLNINTDFHTETNTYDTTVTSGVEEVALPLNINENTTTQIETNTYSTTVKPESFTLPLSSKIESNTNIDYATQAQTTTEIPNQYLNDYQYQTQTETQTKQYLSPPTEIPYVPPTVVQPQITYQTVYPSPKREHIQYTVPNSQFTYSAVESHKNPDILQKIVETTKTTTKQYNPTQVQPPQPQIDMTIYNEKITQLQSETNKIRGEYDSLKNEANKLSGEVGQLRSQITIPLEENKVLRQKNGSMPSQAQIHEITILKQENERLKKQLEQYINIETTFEQYKRLKEQEINYLKLQIEEYIKNQKKLEEIISLKQREIDELKFQIQQLIKNVNISESQNFIMRQQQKGASGSQTLTIQDTRMEIVKGDIIKSSAELELLTRKICQNYQKVTLDLLYKATIDSDKASAFHNKCDWANRTLVLIKSGNGRRFGGYTTCNWKGNSIEKKDDNAFVFSLDKMQIYDIIPGELAIGCYPKYGPVFLGCQIRIYDEFFTKGGTTFEKGLNYNTQEDYELTGGLKKFDVKEIEVYSIELQ